MISELEQLRRRCDELEARLDRVEPWVVRIDLAAISDRERIDAAEHQLHDLLAANTPAQAARPGWKYPNVHRWVEEHFAVVFARGDNAGVNWCPRWYDHTEALVRLTALWRAWETMRRDTDRGMAVWYRDFADSQFDRLTDPTGTFRHCKRELHRSVPPILPTETHG